MTDDQILAAAKEFREAQLANRIANDALACAQAALTAAEERRDEVIVVYRKAKNALLEACGVEQSSWDGLEFQGFNADV